MKAYFNDNGHLVVEAENATERYALNAWRKEHPADNGTGACSHGPLEVKCAKPEELYAKGGIIALNPRNSILERVENIAYQNDKVDHIQA